MMTQAAVVAAIPKKMQLWKTLAAGLLVVAISGADTAQQEPEVKQAVNSNLVNTTKVFKRRLGKQFSVFQVVQFPNLICTGQSRNGTCYTSDECKKRGGTNAGACANGYGICCVFSVRCGATVAQNNTYFESTGSESGACGVSICPLNSGICQLRLDFTQFVISGPSTTSVTSAKILNGQPAQGGTGVTNATQCLTDSFIVTSPSNVAPSIICGTNTGEHMYVDPDMSCNNLVFELGSGSTTGAARTWQIKVTQFSCDFTNLAPPGCTQYYFGSTSSSVRSYNYNGGAGYQLAYQDQVICVRRERGTCRICWSAMNPLDFMISGPSGAALAKTGSGCCGYGPAGMGATSGYDCVMIGSASKAATSAVIPGNVFCGRSKGLGTMAAIATGQTICSRRAPFKLHFLSDGFEFAPEVMPLNMAPATMRGFQLAYQLTSQGC